ncbi:hypothetical protein M2651_10800 [Clostridium sp. SYSU_GA19001]|uniref:PilW family protein n=1 Tax=Clostridium caldaquaticum TaxID=2940653 RepID=UPI0020773D99|nr:hypothetical protein [Clostridium caldaquaticum]MCM8711509.1 hypothetical protein [Clostridium caldaquaticum]
MEKKGVTFIELVAVIGIVLIISAVIFSVFSNGLKTYSTTSGKSILQNSARSVVEEITRNVNNAQVAYPISVSSGKVVVDGNTFNSLSDCYGLVYVKLSSSAGNPFIYVIKNNSVYKIFLDGTGWDLPIGKYIENTSSIDAPFSSNSNALRLRLNLKYRNFSESYTTFMSIGGY